MTCEHEYEEVVAYETLESTAYGAAGSSNPSLNRTPRRVPAVIKIRGNDAWLPRGLFDLVRHLLEAKEADFVRSSKGHYVRKTKSHRFYSTNKQGQPRTSNRGNVRIPAGLVPRVRAYLASKGVRIKIRERRPWKKRHAALTSALDGVPLAWQEREFLHAALSNQLGQIMVDRPSEVAERIDLLLAVFPKYSVAIVAKNKADAKILQRKIAAISIRVPEFYHDNIWRRSPRTLITYPCTATFCNALDFQVVVFADADSAVSDKIDDVFVREPHLRYCFVLNEQRLASHERLKLEAVCGEVIYPPEDEQEVETNVRVYVAEPATVQVDTDDLAPEQRKRKCLWHDNLRNDYVAPIATALADGNLKALHTLGLLLDVEEEVFAQREAELGTVVLVETPEHARELARRLPDWEVLDAKKLPMPGFDERRMDWHESPDRAIVTALFAGLMPIVADFIVRADGTATGWHEGCGPHSYLNDAEMLVIDIADRFDQQARRDSRRRLKDYARRGWQIRQIPRQATRQRSGKADQEEAGGAGRPAGTEAEGDGGTRAIGKAGGQAGADPAAEKPASGKPTNGKPADVRAEPTRLRVPGAAEIRTPRHPHPQPTGRRRQ